jgi:2-hydroxy-3-keto-5-methylthiopentenyl-1-phosphate phosphatase
LKTLPEETMREHTTEVIEDLADEWMAPRSRSPRVPFSRPRRTHVRKEADMSRHLLLASDFDQTLSFNDSGEILSDLIGATGFKEKVAGLSRTNFVQQGGELAYLLRHDPEFRAVRREHLTEVGQRVRLKANIPLLARFLAEGIFGCRFSFYVISAAPQEVVESALEGIVPKDHICASQFDWDLETGEIRSIRRVPAGYGKVAVLDELQAKLGISADRIVYVGDGSSDVHVMLHVNHRDGFTIAVSEARLVTPIARRTLLGDDALGVLVPILEDVVGIDRPRIRSFFEERGLVIAEWDKARTDRLTITSPVDAAL